MNKLKLSYLLILSFIVHQSSVAQEQEKIANEQLKNYEWAMRGLLSTILGDTSKVSRINASEELKKTLEKAFKEKGAFQYPFKQAKGLSIISPDDGAFRIFTWQLYLDENNYQYMGYLQMPDEKFYKLEDKSAEMRSPQYSQLRPEKWYGALYYSVKSFKDEKRQTKYLVFGYDAYDFFRRRKVLDVLHFFRGQPRFGDKVIEMKDHRGTVRNVYRFVMEYSASVSVSMNYSHGKEMVIYDHLVYQMIPGQGPSNVPDGSYCGLELKKGKWKIVDKVYKHNPYVGNDNPPLEHPILDKDKNKSKDIIGRTKRKGKIKID